MGVEPLPCDQLFSRGKLKMRVLLVVLALLFVAPALSQTYYPSGPQKDVALSTVTGGGWSICSQTLYSATLREYPGACPQAGSDDKVMLACRSTGSATIQLLAAAPASDVLTDTGNTSTATHNANGSEWYYDMVDVSGQYAMGFAKGGESISANSCDTLTSGANDERLCFHMYETLDIGGYRCGADRDLNSSGAFERLYLMSDADGDGVADSRDAYPTDASRFATVTPTLPLFGLLALVGLLGLFGSRKLRQ